MLCYEFANSAGRAPDDNIDWFGHTCHGEYIEMLSPQLRRSVRVQLALHVRP